MKVQVVLLLSLMCYSAFSVCGTYHAKTATIGTDVYQIGSDTGLCCVQKNAATAVTLNAVAGTSVCTPRGLYVVGTQVWAVIDVDAVATPLTTTAGSYTEITPAATLISVAIGRLDLTTLQTVAGSYIGSKTAADAFAALSTTASGTIKACTTAPYTNILSIPVTVPTGNLLVDQTKVSNTALTAGTYIGYNTATGNFKGYSADPCADTFTSAATVTLSSVEYQIGKKGNECCLVAGTSYYCYNDVNQPGTCTALDIAADTTSSEVWIAIRVSAAAADVMTAANGITAVDYTDSLMTSATLVADTVLVGKVTTTAGTDFGKFIYAAYVAPKNSGGTYTSFTFTDLRACTSNSVKYAQIEGTLGTNTWTDELGAVVATATGTGAFLVITPATSSIDGFASSGRVCAGASILSVASAILAFVGLVAL